MVISYQLNKKDAGKKVEGPKINYYKYGNDMG